MDHLRSHIRRWIVPILATTGFLLLLMHKREFPVLFSRYSIDYTMLLILYALNLALLWRIVVLRVSYQQLIGRSSAGHVVLLLIVVTSVVLTGHLVDAFSFRQRVMFWLVGGILFQAGLLELIRK